jgi:hypothetical protein
VGAAVTDGADGGEQGAGLGGAGDDAPVDGLRDGGRFHWVRSIGLEASSRSSTA